MSRVLSSMKSLVICMRDELTEVFCRVFVCSEIVNS